MKLEALDAMLSKRTPKDDKEEGEEIARGIEIVVEKDDEFPDEDSLELDLSEALSLLEDCRDILLTLGDPKCRLITPYLRKEIDRISMEAMVFLEQWKMGSLEATDV